MLKRNIHLILFFLFAVGLPLWGMQSNRAYEGSVHACAGECYENWKQETGGVLALAAAKAEAKASASPAELGQAAYAGCIACHGGSGEGGVGPALAGQTENAIYDKLLQYKNAETRGPQSALVWSQSATLSDEDMKNIAAFVESLSAR
jgi:cytochrome c553